jgi:hypothetical protein
MAPPDLGSDPALGLYSLDYCGSRGMGRFAILLGARRLLGSILVVTPFNTRSASRSIVSDLYGKLE